MVAPRGLHGRQRFRLDKGGVAIQNDHIASKICQRGTCHIHGMARAFLFGLQNQLYCLIPRLGRFANGLGAVACHHDAARRLDLGCGFQRMHQ